MHFVAAFIWVFFCTMLMTSESVTVCHHLQEVNIHLHGQTQ